MEHWILILYRYERKAEDKSHKKCIEQGVESVSSEWKFNIQLRYNFIRDLQIHWILDLCNVNT